MAEHVSAMICRTTMIPPSSADEDLMAAQPVSLGDILVNITSDPNHPYHQKLAKQMVDQVSSLDWLIGFIGNCLGENLSLAHPRLNDLTCSLNDLNLQLDIACSIPL